jgi:hypothetical protein
VRLLSYLLAAFLTVVLVVGVLPRDPAARMGLAQMWLLSPVILLGAGGLAFLFQDGVGRFTVVMRLTVLGVAVLAAVRGAWAHVPALLVLALVLQVVHWFAGRLAAGRSLSGALRDARYLFEDLGDRAAGRESRRLRDENAPPRRPPDEDDWPGDRPPRS